MVTETIKIGRLFSWSRNFNVDHNENVGEIVYYPNPDTELHIELTAKSKQKLKDIRDEVLAIMNREITLEGTVVRRREKRIVLKPEEQVEEWFEF